MERLGLGPETVLARNAKLVYGRMTGWGQFDKRCVSTERIEELVSEGILPLG